MENPLLAIFAKIPCTIYSPWSLAQFLSNFKNSQKSNFDRNQLKFSMQHKNTYVYSEKIIKMENPLLVISDKIPNTQYSVFCPNFQKIIKNLMPKYCRKPCSLPLQ